MDNLFSRKIRRNSFLIDPKWTIFCQEQKEERAFRSILLLWGLFSWGKGRYFFFPKSFLAVFFSPKENLVFKVTIIILVIWG